MNAEISETIGATILGIGMQIPEIPAQREFFQLCATPTVAPTVFMLK